MKNILLVDGNSIMNRAFYALMNAGMFRAQDGTYTNAIYGFLNIYFKVIEEYSPEYIAVAFDKGKKTLRHKSYTEYKAGRSKMPDELREQMPIIKEILEEMNVPVYEMDDYEADDILGTLAKNLTKNKEIFTYILTGDRDYFQLVDENINIIYPKNSKGEATQELWNIEKIRENYGNLNPSDLIEVKALMGDTSDNIPGVRGIGEKTAVKLINEYKNIDNLYKKINENEDKLTPKQRQNIIEDKENAFMSRELGKIITNIDFKYELEDLKKEGWNPRVTDIFLKLNLKTFLDKFKLLEDVEIKEIENIPKVIEDEEYIKKEIKNIKDKIYIYHVFEDEIEKFNEKGKKIKQEEVKVMSRELNAVFIYIKEKNEIFKIRNLQILKEVLEKENLEKVFFGSKDFLVFLKRNSIKYGKKNLDLKLAEYLVDSGMSKYEFKNVITKYLSTKYITLFIQDISVGAYLIYLLEKEIIDKLKESNMENVLEDIELPLLDILAEMTYLGIKVDTKKIEDFGKVLEKELEVLTNEIHMFSGEEFNINSPKQLGVILFEKLKLTPFKKTKTGYSTDIKMLEKLKDKHEIIRKIIEYRGKSKLLTTYINGFLPYVDKEDGRVHGRFHQTITRTGRISASDPNLQNIPIRTEEGRILRESFIPKDGYVFVDSDYSQIELRILAHIANDAKMIEAFKEGQDIHRSTASHVLNKDFNDVTPEERSKAKAVNFGIIYGISSFGLSEQLKISVNEAKGYIDEYLEKYSGVKKYMDEMPKIAKKDGYVETLFGRKRYIEELYSNNFNIREFGKRAALNAPIQGTAADIVKLAMINVQKRIEEEKLDANILLQIHDEILLEVKKEDSEKAAKLLKEEMENIIDLKVPLIADVKIGNNWLI